MRNVECFGRVTMLFHRYSSRSCEFVRAAVAVVIAFTCSDFVSAQTTWIRTNGPRDTVGYLGVSGFVRPSSGMLYAYTSNGMYRMNAAGTTWERDSSADNTYLFEHSSERYKVSTDSLTQKQFFSYSSDNGGTWMRGTYPPLSSYVNVLAVAPNHDVYAGMMWSDTGARGGVFRSTDHGATWKHIGLGWMGAHVTDIVVDSSNRIYCVANIPMLARTTDFGATWDTLHIRNDTAWGPVYWVGTILRGDELFVEGCDSLTGQIMNLFRSTDHGDLWTPIYTIPYPDAERIIYDIAIGPLGEIGIATWTRFMVSADDGMSWKSYPLLDTSEYAPRGIIYLDSNSTVYLAQGAATVRSTDDGNQWKDLRDNLWDIPHLLTTAIAVNRTNDVVLTMASKYDWRTQQYSLETFRSSDQGITWQKCIDPLPLPRYAVLASIGPKSTIFMGCDSGVFRTTNDGDAWEEIPSPMVKVFAFAESSHGSLLAVAAGGMFRSIDSGHTWIASGTGMHDDTTRDMSGSVVAISDDGTAYAEVQNVFYRSTDFGISWDSVRPIGAYIPRLTCLSGGAVLCSAAIPTEEDGLFRSTDRGDHWTPCSGIAGQFSRILAISATRVFVSNGNGIFESTDGGFTWPFGDGPSATDFIQGTDGTVYAATDDGVWRTQSPVAVHEHSSLKISPERFSLTVSPQPANDAITLSTSASTSTKCSIIIRSALGSVVYQRMCEHEAGSNALRISTMEWPAGLYLGEVKGGGRIGLAKILVVR